MERKTLAIGIVVIVAIAAGTTGAIIFFIQPEPGEGEEILSIGQMYLPFTIDPQDAWDSASNNPLRQVIETLFIYDYTDRDLPIIPRLAVDFGTWNLARTEYTVDLRTDVKFHDGSTFDADDVIFSFERQNWLYNFTGLNTGYVPDVYELYVLPNGSQIIKDIVKVDADTVRYELTGPFGPFEPLLTYIASGILTETYYNTTGGIVDVTGGVVGTGPFVWDGFDVGVEVTMHAFDDYWRGPAQIDEVIFVGITDANARNAALLSGDIQYLYQPMDEMWDIFNLTSGITIWADAQTLGTQYCGMNNVLIDRNWREVISYAYDYQYLIDEIRLGHGVKMRSPVPLGIKYANWTFPVPELNYTHARLKLQDMGVADPSWNVSEDDEWLFAAATDPLRTFNYTYNIGNEVREAVLPMLVSSLAKVGIRVTDAGGTWGLMLSKLYELSGHTRNELELYFVGWGPDYNDPSNFINPLLTNRSIAANGAQYNGYTEAIAAGRDPMDVNDNAQLLMEAAMIEGDGPIREAMYDRLQQLLIWDMPWCWSYVGQGPAWAHTSNLMGIPYNTMGNYDIYPCYFE